MFKMDFENYFVKYFQSNNYTKWSVLEALRYLSNNVDFTSDSLEDISNALKNQLKILSIHKSVLQVAKNKAIKLLQNLEETLTKRIEILNFFENQDLKFAEVSNTYRLYILIKNKLMMYYYRADTKSMLN